MLIPVVQIGNSKGIRLPKAILDQLQISGKVDLEVENQQIVLKPVKNKPRTGWDDSFREMSDLHEDILFIADDNESEGFEWEW
jgi:antitoxin MazE